MSNPGIDRRVHPRLPTSLPVRISTIDPETDASTRRTYFRASREWCANVSRGGLFLHTSEPLLRGRRVLIELTLPDGRNFDSVGRVAWVQRRVPGVASQDVQGVGIEFLGSATEDLAAFEQFLHEGCPDGASGPRYLV